MTQERKSQISTMPYHKLTSEYNRMLKDILADFPDSSTFAKATMEEFLYLCKVYKDYIKQIIKNANPTPDFIERLKAESANIDNTVSYFTYFA